MMEKRAILIYDFKNEKQVFIDELLNNCNIDSISGELFCKKCGNLVKIDWFRNHAFCGVHIISKLGVEYKEMNNEIYL